MTAIGVLAFVAALIVSIMLHEFGHLLTAKRFGMKATQYFLGFGPTVWSFRRGETEYGVKAVWAGGFVKIIGMTPLEEVEPEDEARAFYRQPPLQRAVVLAAGSVMHFVIALVLLVLVFGAIGTPQLTTKVRQVAACVPAEVSSAANSASCAGQPPSPARAAGLQAGDRVIAFDGAAVRTWDSFASAVRRHGPGAASVAVERDGVRRTLHVDLAAQRQPVSDASSKTHVVGVLGVSPSRERHVVSPVSAFHESGSAFAQYVTATFTALGDLPSSVPKLFDTSVAGGQRDATGLVGPVGLGRVSASAFTQQAPWYDRISTFLLLVIGLNVFVGIFNLLPLLPLDGGHLAILGFEQARSRVYRLLGRGDPGRVDLTRLLPAAYLVMVLFIGLSVLLLLEDIVNPIANPFGG